MLTIVSLLRPRTLLLAFAVILCGNALAYHTGTFRLDIFLLSLLTALTLQILSNIANDYGDGIRGTDKHRAPNAPRRITVHADINPTYIRRLIVFTIILCIFFGLTLLTISVKSSLQFWLFLFFGSLSILAALGYTLGRYAYGYYGFGEIAVFIFFGLIGVIGSYTLQTDSINFPAILPACAAGLLASAVLNINNIRDIDSDSRAGKHTIAVRLGFTRAKILNSLFYLGALCCYLIYAICFVPLTALPLLLCPIIYIHCRHIYRAQTQTSVGRKLKSAVLLNFAANLLFSLGLVISL